MRTRKIYRMGIFVITFISLLNPLYFLLLGKKAVGTVVEYTTRTVQGKLGGTYIYPIVEFRANGSTIRFAGEENLMLDIGSTVTVVYDASEPHNAKIFSFLGLFTYPLIILATGLFIWYAFISSFKTIFDKPIIIYTNPNEAPDTTYRDLPRGLKIVFKVILMIIMATLLLGLISIFSLYWGGGVDSKVLPVAAIIFFAITYPMVKEFRRL